MDILTDSLDFGSSFFDDSIVIDIRVAEERFIGDGVPAFVDAQVDVAGLFEPFEDFADDIFVTVLARPNERVIAAIEELPGFDKAL